MGWQHYLTRLYAVKGGYISFLWRRLNRDKKVIHYLPKSSLVESYDSFYKATATMPPKRKAATAVVEPVADVPLPREEPSSSISSPIKLRKRQVKEDPPKKPLKPRLAGGSKEKDVPEKKKVLRGKKTAKAVEEETAVPSQKEEEKSNEVDTKRRNKKKEDSANGIVEEKVVKEKVTRKKKEEKPTKEAEVTKTKRKKNDEEKVEKSGPTNSTITKWEKIDFSCTKQNGEGRMANLKISCWNVGGLKSWIKKECHQYLEYESPDILCVQETKCSEEKLPEEIKNLQGYEQYWCASKKEGYAGVGLLTKTEPLEVSYGINVPELDEDGRCITAEYDDYYIICVYVPNAGRKLVTLPKRLEWNTAFKDYVKGLDDKKPVIICGDMNVAHDEIDLARPANNTKNAGFTKEEREGMTDFLQDGYIDTFRRLYPEKRDVYTFWTYMAGARAKNVGWRLDYFIISERIMDKVCDHVMRSEVMGSDHCPITLFINI